MTYYSIYTNNKTTNPCNQNLIKAQNNKSRVARMWLNAKQIDDIF